MTVLSIDFETRATVNLKDTGVYPYAQHKHTDIWCMAWAFDDEEPRIWTPPGSGDEPLYCIYCETGNAWKTCPGCGGPQQGHLPQRIVDHIRDGGEIRAWNAEFERIIWNHIMVERYGAPKPALEQWVCSAAEAAAMALPRALGQCAQVVGAPHQKDDAGHRLMMQMTRPRRFESDGTPVWWDVEEKKQKLFEYCRQDVRTERAVVPKLRRLTEKERQHYLQTARMNDRGITLDIALVQAAKQMATEGVERANAALHEITKGEVSEVTNHGRLTSWLRGQGVETTGVSKPAVRDLLTGELIPPVRAALELRQEAGRSSLAKLDSFQACVCPDGRIRGMLLYHGASTGRWTGRLAQLHNLARPTIDNIEDFIDAVLVGDYDGLDLIHSPLEVIVSMLRSMLTAASGHELIAADYSAIEARVLNWFAGQDDVCSLFANGEDVYSYNAGRLPRAEPYVKGKKHPWRQTGKFQELACGYGMGAKKGVSAAKDVYGLIVSPEEMDVIVKGYRQTHGRVVDLWYESERAAMEAVEKPGSVVTFGARRNLRFTQRGAYLYLLLPAGRPLVYAAPKIVERMTPWKELKPAVEISAVNNFTRQWSRQGMYGGLWVENIVQAASRDIMAEAKLRLEERGYPVLLSVHDEIVSEVPEGFGSVEEYEAILSELPEWAAGCPITAEGWRGFRYRK